MMRISAMGAESPTGLCSNSSRPCSNSGSIRLSVARPSHSVGSTATTQQHSSFAHQGKTISVTATSPSNSHASQLSKLKEEILQFAPRFGLQSTQWTSTNDSGRIEVDGDAIERSVEELSGSQARKLCSLVIKTVLSCAGQQPSFPLGCRADHLSAFSQAASPVMQALLRPTFAAIDSNGASGNSLPEPPAEFTPANSNLALHREISYSSAFRSKPRRESVESFASQAILPFTIRNTTSIERSVDPEGFKTINDYSVLRPLGKGSCGKVKLAVHHETGELRAIKIVKRSLVKKLQGPHGVDRLRKEVAIMKKLNHKHIVKLYEVIDDPQSDKMYFVMQFVEHGEVLNSCGDADDSSGQLSYEPLPEEKVSRYVRQAASGLVYLHNHGIVHFDVKPQNILRGRDDNVFLADFGVSELMVSSEGNTVKSSGLGSPAFMAPEVCRGDAIVNGEACDVWSLGVTAYVMLYGHLPWAAVGVRQLFEEVTDPQQPVSYPPGASGLQIDFLSKLLDKDPSRRWTLRQLREHCFLHRDGMAMSVSMACKADVFGESSPSPRRPDHTTGSEELQKQQQRNNYQFVHVTQRDIDSALSTMLSPLSGCGEEVISSCSRSVSERTALSTESAPSEMLDHDPLPPQDSIHPINPRARMSMLVGGTSDTGFPAPRQGSFAHAYVMQSVGSVVLDNARVRRETQVMLS